MMRSAAFLAAAQALLGAVVIGQALLEQVHGVAQLGGARGDHAFELIHLQLRLLREPPLLRHRARELEDLDVVEWLFEQH